MSRQFRIRPGGVLRGELRVPGDKSISHRAVMFASLAEGRSRIGGFLDGADCLATLGAFRAMGVAAEIRGTEVQIQGRGLYGLQAPDAPLDVGNSGTSMRLLAGILSGQRFASTLIGDASLSRRPMGRVVDPLRRMGARISARPAGTAPLQIEPADGLVGIEYDSPVASAQVKSALLLAGLYADGETTVREPGASRDHTERMLRAFGVQLHAEPGVARLRGGQRLRASHITVPADISSAAFFLVGAAITPGSELRLPGVGMNPTRDGVVQILRRMGADIRVEHPHELGGEPVADLHVRGGELRGIEVPESLVPSAIDEFPALFIAAACAEGETRVSGAAELRVKESDRIGVMVDGLRGLGIEAEATDDGAVIRGGRIGGGRLEAQHDHRIAMAFAMAGLRAGGEILIDGCDTVDTSFPGFATLAAAAGLDIEVRET